MQQLRQDDLTRRLAKEGRREQTTTDIGLEAALHSRRASQRKAVQAHRRTKRDANPHFGSAYEGRRDFRHAPMGQRGAGCNLQ